MKFVQEKRTGDVDWSFTWKERFLIFFKGKVTLPVASVRTFGNHLMEILGEWYLAMDKETKLQSSKRGDKVDLK